MSKMDAPNQTQAVCRKRSTIPRLRISQNCETISKTQKLTVRFLRLHIRRTRHGEGLAVRNEDRAQNWFQVIQECRDSGLTNREFCRQRGIRRRSSTTGFEAAHAGIGGGTASDCAYISWGCSRGCAPNSFSRRRAAASRNGRSRRSGRGFAFHSNGMIDLSQVRRYYVACGYTDLRRGIDGLAAIVTQQFGAQLNEESLFLFAVAGQIGSRRSTGLETDIFCCTSG